MTFHKAFDVVIDPFEALGTLIDLGVDRVLTSGQATTAEAGLDRLAELVQFAAGRVIIMAGGSISEAAIPRLLGAGLEEIHVGSAAMVDGTTDAGRVRTIVRLVLGRGFY